MKIYVMAKSYNCYGGHMSLSSIGDFLLMGAPDFGDAVRELTVTLCFYDPGPPRGTLESLFKLRGVCDQHVKQLALEAMAYQRREAEESTRWEHHGERLQTLK